MKLNILEAIIGLIYLNLEGLEREGGTIKACYFKEDKPLIKKLSGTQTHTQIPLKPQVGYQSSLGDKNQILFNLKVTKKCSQKE